MKKSLVLGLIIAVSATFSTVLAENDPIKLGSILILSGEGSANGRASRNGIDMAVEKLNGEGGVLGRPITVNYQDDHGDPKASISAFRELSDAQKVNFIIGPSWSNLALPLIDLAERSKTIIISPSVGVAKFNEANKYLFSTWPHDSLLSEKLAEYVINKGYRNVALVGAEQVWVKEQTQAFQRRFEALGGHIAYLTEPLPGTRDLRTEALKIKNNPRIDAYISTTDGIIVGSLVAKALKEMNIRLPMFSITLDQAAIDAAHGGFEGLEFLTSLTPDPEFKQKYEERYHTKVDIGADTAYDAVMMLAQAIREANSTDSDAVTEKLAGIKTYSGVSGKLISDGKRSFVKEFALKKVVGGVPQDL